MEYGIINERGYLSTKIIEEYPMAYHDNDGNIKYRTVTIEEQENILKQQGFKPVDEVDSSKLKTDEGYFIRIVPFDNGERISFRYERVIDMQFKRKKIETLKAELSSSDYKISKCYEASLIGKPLPYDIAKLHSFRQGLRDEINELEGNS